MGLAAVSLTYLAAKATALGELVQHNCHNAVKVVQDHQFDSD